MALDDIQNQIDTRKLNIDRVGICALRYPIQVARETGEVCHSVARFSVATDLDAARRGTHMSRLVELVHAQGRRVGRRELLALTEAVRERLDANFGQVSVTFPFFVLRTAPVTGAEHWVDLDVEQRVSVWPDRIESRLGVRVPVTSLCPCSKAISRYGAHNQRGELEVAVYGADGPGIEQLVECAEQAASSPVYAVLKREDEKFVTEQAYENPVFVEDMVRNVAASLRESSQIDGFDVRARNAESIHNHDAWAEIIWRRAHSKQP